MQLLYHGSCYPHTTTGNQSAYQPRAINWRDRLFGIAQFESLIDNSTVKSPSCLPRVINWHYQISGEV
jgi:hypothetical protein